MTAWRSSRGRPMIDRFSDAPDRNPDGDRTVPARRPVADNVPVMTRPIPSVALGVVITAWLVTGAVLLSACGGCQREAPEAASDVPFHGVSGTLVPGAVAPAGDGPWTIGVALFDDVAWEPDELEALDEPVRWETVTVEQLPAAFSVDHGSPFRGWLVIVLDEDGSGLPDGPLEGDLVGMHPEQIATPAGDLTIYLQDIWDR